MFRLLLFFITALLIACSSSYNSPIQNNYKANMNNEQFFNQIPELMKSANFNISEKNEKEGVLKFQKEVVISESHSLSINIDFQINENTRNVNSIVKALIKIDNATHTEYYNIDCYREEYQSYFLDALKSVKNICTKVSFSNPPR